MQNKKIFFLADANSIHTVKWVDYFIDRGYSVYLATFANNNKTKCKNIYYLGKKEPNVRGGNYYYLLKISKLAKIFKELKPDYINAHYSYSMGLIALLAKKMSKIDSELSIVCHGSDILDVPIPFIFDRVNRYVLSNSNKIFSVSDQITDKIKSFGISEDKIFTGQYGIEIAKKDYKKSIDIISNRTYNENSRINFLLEAIDAMDIRNLKIVFVLPTALDKDIKKLRNKYPYIVFYKSIEYDKMQELLSQAKVYISATKSDGTSLSLLEAMSNNCIPVVSNIVANRSWILDYINGYLFNNASEFKDKLKEAIIKKDSENIVKINLDLIEKKANYKKQMQKIEKFLVKSKL